MPTISAKIIKHPRKQRDCDICLKPIIGETARLYGCGMEGDPLYVMYLHPACVTGISALRKLQAAQHCVNSDAPLCSACGLEPVYENDLCWNCLPG
jgi:hypothetical protein